MRHFLSCQAVPLLICSFVSEDLRFEYHPEHWLFWNVLRDIPQPLQENSYIFPRITPTHYSKVIPSVWFGLFYVPVSMSGYKASSDGIDWWIANFKRYGSKLLWSNRGTISAVAWRDWENHKYAQSELSVSGRYSNQVPPAYKSSVLSLHQSARFYIITLSFDVVCGTLRTVPLEKQTSTSINKDTIRDTMTSRSFNPSP
jgi:hypothetical protein